MGFSTQLCGHPNFKPKCVSHSVIGDMNRNFHPSAIPHMKLGGMSIIFGGFARERSHFTGEIVHQPPHYDGPFDNDTIQMLKERGLSQPLVTMFPLNEGGSHSIYFCETLEGKPTFVQIDWNEILIFTQFTCHCGMTYCSDDGLDKWHPAFHANFGSTLVTYDPNETHLDETAVANNFPDHKTQRDVIATLREKLKNATMGAMETERNNNKTTNTVNKIIADLKDSLIYE
jgi:hypothetical protein